MSGADAVDDRDPIERIAEEFADRHRRGETVRVEDYASKHPDLASDLRRLLPTVAFLELGKSAVGRSRSGRSRGPAPDEAPPVERLGDNRIVRELGRGGMGIVYEAEQEGLGRRVAVKVLPSHARFDESCRRRFLREAKAIALLDHPNIVPIHAVAEADGVPYYVMGLVEGAGLDRLLAGDVPGRSDAAVLEHARWVAGLGRQAAEALAYAHARGVLHRDVKPANLLLDRVGKLWLADFGLAKLVDDLALTYTGDLPGTLRYLAPECLHNEGDARSDVYSLGLTLYELLCGDPAFDESNRVRLMRQIQETEPRPLRERNPEFPRDLETIIHKAMTREPSGRYATAAEMAEDLRRFLEGEPILARRSGRIERSLLWARRNRTVAALGGACIGLALIATVLAAMAIMAPPMPLPPDDRPALKGRFPRDGFGPPPASKMFPFDGPPPRRRPGPPQKGGRDRP